MPTLTLTTKYKKNTGLVISPEELMSLYFYGLKIQSTDGTNLDRQTIITNILAAQAEIERFFDIKLFPVLITESQDYFRDDYQNGFPFVRVSFPIRGSVLSCIGLLNGVEQIKYPQGWLQSRTSSQNRYYRQFAIVPNGSVAQADANIIMIGISAQYGLRSFPQIPNYWNIQYESGYLYGQLPYEIVNLIGLLASIPLLGIAGDLVLSTPGLASTSLGLDGLSQSVTSKAGAFGERIKLYLEQIKTTSQRIKNTYKGVQFVSL
jgi:hypothetical protein